MINMQVGLLRNDRLPFGVSAAHSDNILIHFDSKLELSLARDASPYGVGAVLSHRFLDGFENLLLLRRKIWHQPRSATRK